MSTKMLVKKVIVADFSYRIFVALEAAKTKYAGPQDDLVRALQELSDITDRWRRDQANAIIPAGVEVHKGDIREAINSVHTVARERAAIAILSILDELNDDLLDLVNWSRKKVIYVSLIAWVAMALLAAASVGLAWYGHATLYRQLI